MTELLSDEELLNIIHQHPEHMNATEKGYGGYTAEDLLKIFNTQKRLYAESIIGTRPLGIFNGSNDIEAFKKIGAGDLWDEQRARIK